MHIAFFTNFYHPIVNGVVRSVASFRETLMKQGHNVFVFAQSDGSYKDNEPFIFRYPSLPLPSGEISAAIPVSPFVDQLLPALKLDVIHTHHPILLGQTAARKAAELGLPLVFTFHTQYWEYTHYIPFPQEVIQEFLKNAVHKWLKEFMQKCQHIIIPSESMKEILVRDYGLEANLRLVLIGDGTAKESLQELAYDLGISERVTFTGSLPFEEVPAYLKAADAFSFASITETQGLVTIEAMAAGLPVVAVDGSGTRDIVEHGKQGYLVENDADALAKGLHQLLSDPGQMKRFRHNALKKSKAFDVDLLSKQMISVYEQAIQDKKADQFVTLKAAEAAAAVSASQV